MPLKFEGTWRFRPPTDGQFQNERIPDVAVEEFYGLIMKIATQVDRRDRQKILEHFKGHFCEKVGVTHVWSSSAGWAETDLNNYMYEAAQNAPLFLEAFFDACETLSQNNLECAVPDIKLINEVCMKHRIGYEIRPPYLVLRETEPPSVTLPERPPTLAERAVEIFHTSLRRSEELLAERKGREAVQELLWLLETVSTAFRGLETQCGKVEGKYFNQIIRDLRKSNPGTTLDRILDWMTNLYGYLSSPTGGGVRHGLDLNEGITISLNEARLFCNLIRSYLWFLLAEHERLMVEKRTISIKR